MTIVLAVGVGANAAMVTLIQRLVLVSPAQIKDPEQLAIIHGSENYVHYATLNSAARTVDVASYVRNKVSFGSGARAAEIRVECVTPNYFRLLGISPVQGAAFPATESGAEPTLVVSYGFWTQYFGRASDVLGKAFVVGNRSFTLTGIAPPNFRGIELEPVDAWILLTAGRSSCSFAGIDLLDNSTSAWLKTIGKPRPGFSLTQADAELRSLSDEGCDSNGVSAAQQCFRTQPVLGWLQRSVSKDRQLAMWLWGAAASVLLVACFNVAGLLSIHTVSRRYEFAARLQLGASRFAIFRQLIVENTMLALPCSIVSVLVMLWMGSLFRVYFPAGVMEQLVSAQAVIAMGLLAAVAAFVAGLVPAFQGARTELSLVTRSGRSLMLRASRIRDSLLVLQVGVALVLVLGAALFVRSVHNAKSNLGFSLDRVIAAKVDLRKAGFSNDETYSIYGGFLDELRRIPSVDSATVSTESLLDDGPQLKRGIRKPGADGLGGSYRMNAVSPDYFRTLSVPVIRGRSFTSLDDASSNLVMIIDDQLAKSTWPADEAIGQCAFVSRLNVCVQVVGVIRSRRSYTITGVESEILIPLAQASKHSTWLLPQVLLVRTRTSIESAVPAVARAVRGSADRLPFTSVQPLEDLADIQARSWRFASTTLTFVGATALLLMAIGIYGAMAFSLEQRTAEFGVRLALGASASQIASMVLWHGTKLVVLGWIFGSMLALGLSKHIQAFLFNVAPTDRAALLVATGVIFASGLTACAGPVLRAGNVSPVDALRHN